MTALGDSLITQNAIANAEDAAAAAAAAASDGRDKPSQSSLASPY